MYFKQFYFADEQLNEDSSLQNLFFKTIGSQKRKVFPERYKNFVIGQKGRNEAIGIFAKEAIMSKQGQKPAKKKIWITNAFIGISPKLDKLKEINYKTTEGNSINFWTPVAKIKEVTLYTTNISVARTIGGIVAAVATVGAVTPAVGGAIGDICLWTVQTIANFDELGDQKEELESQGWKPNTTEYILSVNSKGEKYWINMFGMPLSTWVDYSQTGGSTNDPFGSADMKTALMTLTKALNTGEANKQPTTTPTKPVEANKSAEAPIAQTHSQSTVTKPEEPFKTASKPVINTSKQKVVQSKPDKKSKNKFSSTDVKDIIQKAKQNKANQRKK